MMMLDQVCIEVADFEPAARLTRRLGQSADGRGARG